MGKSRALMWGACCSNLEMPCNGEYLFHRRGYTWERCFNKGHGIQNAGVVASPALQEGVTEQVRMITWRPTAMSR